MLLYWLVHRVLGLAAGLVAALALAVAPISAVKSRNWYLLSRRARAAEWWRDGRCNRRPGSKARMVDSPVSRPGIGLVVAARQ